MHTIVAATTRKLSALCRTTLWRQFTITLSAVFTVKSSILVFAEVRFDFNRQFSVAKFSIWKTVAERLRVSALSLEAAMCPSSSCDTNTTEVTTSQQQSSEQAREYRLGIATVFQSRSHNDTTMKPSADCEELFWGQWREM